MVVLESFRRKAENCLEMGLGGYGGFPLVNRLENGLEKEDWWIAEELERNEITMGPPAAHPRPKAIMNHRSNTRPHSVPDVIDVRPREPHPESRSLCEMGHKNGSNPAHTTVQMPPFRMRRRRSQILFEQAPRRAVSARTVPNALGAGRPQQLPTQVITLAGQCQGLDFWSRWCFYSW